MNRLVPQFWAYAQVLSKSWFLFTSGLHEHDDEWNQTVSKQIHDVCLMMKTADLLPVDYTEWYAFMKGWIDDFKKTRTQLLATRDVPAGVSPAGAAGQSDAVGVSPAVEPSSALPSQGEPSWEEISTGDSAGSMTGELLEFREQQRQEREKLAAWARVYGGPPPENSTIKRSTHRFEQWLEGQLKVNRDTLAQQTHEREVFQK